MTRADPTANLPPVRVEPDARRRIRRALVEAGRRIAVLDDDPTGSQTVHDVDVVTVFEPDEIAAGLSSAGSTCFFLTNTRSLSEADAVELNTRIGRMLFDLATRLGAPIDMVSRSDSTLRGHVIAEVRALDAVRRQAIGRGFDGVLMVPAYFEAGRFTAGNVHWARVGAGVLPASETEFAHDATFGYAASDLRDFVAEKSGGAVQPGDVLSITHDDIRLGGPRRVAELLAGVTGGRFVVVNAVEYADLDVVVLGLLEAAAAGRSFLYRSGPSFVQALAGLDPRDPLQASDIWPAGHPGGHGLIVVGSHVGLTSRQVAVARRYGGLTEVELDVAAIADAGRRDARLADATRQVVSTLDRSEVLLFTSRDLLRGRDATESLEISRQVSTAVTEVVRAALAARPAWVVAKGGITSHDVAVRGLGIRRAKVLGQLLPGMVSVFRPIDAALRLSARPMSCSPATSVTRRPWRRSLTCSGGEPDARLPNRRRYHRRMTGGGAWRAGWLVWLAVLAVLVAGCERSLEPGGDRPSRPPATTAAEATPAGLRVQEYPVPAGSRPHDVAPAADGRSVWYTAQGSGQLGLLDPATGKSRLIRLGDGSAPHGVIVGPDGAPWITDGGLNAIVRVDPRTGKVDRYPLPPGRGSANLNTAAFRGGVLWFTGQAGVLGRLDPKVGRVEVFDAPRGPGPYGITATPDGQVFYASLAGSHIGRIDHRTGAAEVLEPPTGGQGARRVWSDSRGRIWVSEWNAGQLGRYDPADGRWREWKLPGPNPMAYAVYVDEDDHPWLSDFAANALVRFDPSTERFTVVALPSSPANVRQLLGRPSEVWGAESGVDKLVVVRAS